MIQEASETRMPVPVPGGIRVIVVTICDIRFFRVVNVSYVELSVPEAHDVLNHDKISCKRLTSYELLDIWDYDKLW